MSIQSFIRKVCVQTAVYWSAPVADGYGGHTYTCTDILCRWDDVTELITNKNGKEIASSAQILVTQDIDSEGFLYLGAKASLSAQQQANPLLVPTAFPVQKVEKSPEFRSTNKFVRVVYL